MKSFFFILAGLTWAVSVSHAEPKPSADSPARYNVVWDSPSKNSDGSMPIGNGDIGANVWMEPNGDLIFYISKTDAWGDNGRLLKVGKVRVTCSPAVPTSARFRQTLDLETGSIVIDAKQGDLDIQMSVWVDANRPVIHVGHRSSKPVSMTARVELWRTEAQEYAMATTSDLQEDRSKKNKLAKKVIIEPDTIVKGLDQQLAWYHHNIKSDGFAMSNKLQGLGEYFKEDPLLHRTFGGLISGAGAQRLDDTTLRTEESTSGHIDVTVLSAHPSSPEQWLKQAKETSKEATAIPVNQRQAAHREWWKRFWSRSWIHITENELAGKRMIPVSKHTVKVGSDQGGRNGFGGEVARASFIKNALTEQQIAALAQDERKPLGKYRDLIGSWGDLTAGHALTDVSQADLSGSVTMETWIKPGQGSGRILDMISAGGVDGFLLDKHPGTSLRLIVGRTTINKTNCLQAGKWHHVAAVIDPQNSSLTLYVDGRKVAIHISKADRDSEVVSRSYALQRFMDACAGRGKHPIKFNGSIFTAPHQGDPDYRRWGPGYWWQNTRLPYLSMCAAGDYDLMQPLFKMYADDVFKLNQFRTRKYLGHGGVFYPECIYFWGSTFTMTYGWTPFEQRKDKLQESGWHKWEWVAGPELVFMMLDYYDYCQDEEFLKTKILPVAIEVIRFFDEHYKTNADGELVMHPSMACETWWDCTNPMPELAGLHGITTRLLSLPEGRLSQEEREFCAVFKKKLAPLPTRDVKGEKALAPATRFAAKRNVENPELYAVFPFRLCSFEKGNAGLGEAALKHRWDRGASGWRQDDLFMAYLGLADQTRDNLVKRCRSHHQGSRFPAFWGPNYDWVPDQDHGGVMMKTLQAMILQPDPYSRKMYINPALPKDWNCEFKLHAPYRTTIEGTIINGKVSKLQVTPESRRADIVLAN